MAGETYKNQYKKWQVLKPFQIRFIGEGPKNQFQG